MLFYLFTEENYVSSLRSIFHMERSIYKYLHAAHDMVAIIKNHHTDEDDDLLVTIKTCIFPLLQTIADLEGILLRKSFYIIEHTCPRTQIATIPFISKESSHEDTLKTKTLLYDIKKNIKQLCPNRNQIIDETVEKILHLETRRKQVFVPNYQWKKNNDPSKVLLTIKS
ncbi:hypothetical protein SAMN04488574_106138 [Bacillus sp. 71mf]|nr:hypothetical protein SAMN04488574_106138 [Bacillus sp. 71mf]SFS67196.1 hypothetical protein SAMN04488145_102321 [Bacillus sp. 103mf]